MSDVFNGYELLLFKRFQSHPEDWKEWREKLKEREDKGGGGFWDVPQELWFLSVALHHRPKYLLQLIDEETEREKRQQVRRHGDTLLTTYLNMNHFTEFHLDRIFKYGEDNKLPKEIFKCKNIRLLSLKYNCLYELPPDIGRLQKLEFLAVSNNRLHVQSLPYTLTFCSSLKTVYLDNNLLDALPGFLLQMPNIETVHRHGNHNYFKSTFMWYHTDVNFRIIPLGRVADTLPVKAASLTFWAAKALVGSKVNFFNEELVAPVLGDYICNIYEQFNVCQNCQTCCLNTQPGYKVITFKNPYLGNTCVPFQHWVCSFECAKALEVPARLEQIARAKELDSKYETYIQECQQYFENRKPVRKLFPCVSKSPDDSFSESEFAVTDSGSFSFCSTESDYDISLPSSSSKKCIIM